MERGSTNLRQQGNQAEQEARRFLEKKGYVWRRSNYFTRLGEIDLIMEKGATLVFVEVKQRANTNHGVPYEAVTYRKKKRIVQAAIHYLQEKGLTDRLVQFDVVSLAPGGITHFPNAFLAGNEYYI